MHVSCCVGAHKHGQTFSAGHRNTSMGARTRIVHPSSGVVERSIIWAEYAGRRYRDDPAIFGWDLINEPRCNCFPSKLPPSSEWDTLEGSCSPGCANKITVSPLSCCLLISCNRHQTKTTLAINPSQRPHFLAHPPNKGKP